MHTGAVLKSPETRKACTILENIEAALATLDTLPAPVLEALRNHVADQAKDQTGAASDFWRAFETYLAEPLNAARLRDRQETFGMYSELR
jgi:hypothetical protein